MDLGKQLNDWNTDSRVRGDLNYIDVIANSIPRALDEGVFDLVGQSDFEVGMNNFAASLMYFYASNSQFRTNSWTVKELGQGGRERTLRINAEPFCAAKSVPLPPRNSNSQLVDWHPMDSFKARVNAALLTFDHVLVIDPCPRVFRWATGSWINSAGIVGNAHDFQSTRSVPLDYEKPFSHELEDHDILALERWLKFCRDYKLFFQAGRLFAAPDRYPDWLIPYKSGEEADKPKYGEFERILSSPINELSEPMFLRFQSQDWGAENSDELLRQVFWQSHYLGNGSISVESMERADWLVSQLGGINDELGEVTDASLSIASHIFKLRYGLCLEGITPNEILNVSSSDEIISILRSCVRDVGELSLLSSREFDEQVGVLSDKFEEFESKVDELRASSNFLSGVFVPSRDSGLAAIGAGASTFMTAAEANVILWAGLGALFPLAAMLPFHISRGVEKHKVSARANTLLTRLNAN
ncbi:hypothetical protein [Aliiroseovarius sp. YM-037]|uniref:hypothetical protein n=1 Tax=Aliiroseovarius sp. YM-037 TaxID=3341728 RepID=UPI003A80408F